MTLDIIAWSPPPGVWAGIDTAGDDDSPGNVITPDVAAALRAEGIRWVARYTMPDGTVPANPSAGGSYQGCWPLSLAEQGWILGGGLGIVGVQFGVFGDAKYGSDKGRAAARCARRYGWAPGTHHFMDVEGSRPAAAGPDGCKRYMEAWAAANNADSWATGQYSTGQVPLSASQMYHLRGITCNWSAAGPVPANPLPRAHSIEQDPETTVCGIRCDTDTMRPDRFGDTPKIVVTPEIASDWMAEALTHLVDAPFLTV